MKATIFKKPDTHIVIDDFFTRREYQSVLTEIASLEPLLHRGRMRLDDSGIEKESFQKENLNLWLDDHFKRISDSQILRNVQKVYSAPMVELYEKTKDTLFKYVNHTNIQKTLLSVYKNSQFYSVHRDFSLITFVFFVCNRPKKFTGGDFYLSGISSHRERPGNDLSRMNNKYKKIEFKPNRLIIFPSPCYHFVSPVQFKNEKDASYENCRFSIQHWPNIVS